jgi:hypothetical protein
MSAEPDPREDLNDLQARLEELQESVRRLGSEECPPPRVAAMPPAEPAEPAPAATNGHSNGGAPAATNGHSNGSSTHTIDPAEISALSSTVALVDAGPFADLIELRRFEEDLASLAAVRDVRVRRFGQGRATIEVGMTGAYDLGRELPAIPRGMQIAHGPDGEVVVELEAVEATDGEDEEAES